MNSTATLSAHETYKEVKIPWLEKIPTHWDILKTKYVAQLETGHTPSRSQEEYWDGDIPWYSLADVWQVREEGRKYITETEESITEEGIRNSSARILPEGTVVISRTASIGFPCILGVPAATDQSMVAWVCGHEILPEYLYFVFRSMDQEFERLAFGSTHKTIYMSDVNELSNPLPPVHEQKEIIEKIENFTNTYQELKANIEHSSVLFKEKRQDLIRAAISGQIDVSDWDSPAEEAEMSV